jgi:hypothetical protein
MDNKHGLCPHCSQMMSGSIPMLGSKCSCETSPPSQSAKPADTQTIIRKLWNENADLREKLAASDKARDEQAEAVRVLGRELFTRCFLGYDKAWVESEIAKINNPTAAAAVKEAGQ